LDRSGWYAEESAVHRTIQEFHMHATPVTETFQRRTTQKQRSASLDPPVADRLLDLLSTDDVFRQLFQTSPQAAPQHWIRAPSKQAIRDARTVLKEVLMKGLTTHRHRTP
jgi:hypothetical protein